MAVSFELFQGDHLESPDEPLLQPTIPRATMRTTALDFKTVRMFLDPPKKAVSSRSHDGPVKPA